MANDTIWGLYLYSPSKKKIWKTRIRNEDKCDDKALKIKNIQKCILLPNYLLELSNSETRNI